MSISAIIKPVACLWNPNLTGLTAWLISEPANIPPAAVDSQLLQCAQPCQSGAMVLVPDVATSQPSFLCYCYPNSIDALLRIAPNNGTCSKRCGGTDAAYSCGGVQGSVVEGSVYIVVNAPNPASTSSDAATTTSISPALQTAIFPTLSVATDFVASTRDLRSVSTSSASSTATANAGHALSPTPNADKRVIWGVFGGYVFVALAAGLIALHRSRKPTKPDRSSRTPAQPSAKASKGPLSFVSSFVRNPSEDRLPLQHPAPPRSRNARASEWRNTVISSPAMAHAGPQRSRSVSSSRSHGTTSSDGRSWVTSRRGSVGVEAFPRAAAPTPRRGSSATTTTVASQRPQANSAVASQRFPASPSPRHNSSDSQPMNDAAYLESTASQGRDTGAAPPVNMARRSSRVSRSGSNSSNRSGHNAQGSVPPVPALPQSIMRQPSSSSMRSYQHQDAGTAPPVPAMPPSVARSNSNGSTRSGGYNQDAAPPVPAMPPSILRQTSNGSNRSGYQYQQQAAAASPVPAIPQQMVMQQHLGNPTMPMDYYAEAGSPVPGSPPSLVLRQNSSASMRWGFHQETGPVPPVPHLPLPSINSPVPMMISPMPPMSPQPMASRQYSSPSTQQQVTSPLPPMSPPPIPSRQYSSPSMQLAYYGEVVHGLQPQMAMRGPVAGGDGGYSAGYRDVVVQSEDGEVKVVQAYANGWEADTLVEGRREY